DNEERPKVDDGDPAFHALEVGPETAQRIDAAEISDQGDKSEYSHADGKRRRLRTVFCIEACEDEPDGKSYFDQNAEIERCAGNKREEKRVRDDKRKDRNEEEERDRDAAQNFLESHGNDYSMPGLNVKLQGVLGVNFWESLIPDLVHAGIIRFLVFEQFPG